MADNLNSKIRSYLNEQKIIGLLMVLIVGAFLFLRLFNLTLLPVFVDEAIYVRWAQVMKAEPTLRFLPMFDGKQPLFMWLVMPFLAIFSDPLFAGRFVSVLAGLGNLVGIFFLGCQLFKSKIIGMIAVFLYAIVPFALFFDRMALADSLLSMFGIWVMLLSIYLVNNPRFDLAMIAGIILGCALITKSPATFFALFIPLPLILTNFQGFKKMVVRLVKLLPFWLITYSFAFVIYNLLRLGPNFHMIALRNQDYVFPLSNILYHPFDPFQFHLLDIYHWLGNMLTPPVFLSVLLGIIWLLIKDRKIGIFLLCCTLGPLLAQAEYAKVFTARYIFFTVPYFLLFSSFFLYEILARFYFRKILFAFIILILFAPSLVYDYFLLFNPEKAPLPKKERQGYLEEWTAGTGIKEAAGYLKEAAKTKQILIGTEGYFGTLPDGLQMYLEKVPNITIIGVGLNLDTVPQPLTSARAQNEVYLLINDGRLKLDPRQNNLDLIASYPKAKRANGSYESLLLFVVK